MSKANRIYRQRKQTPEQEVEEKAIREKFQKEKPSLQELIDSGDLTEVSTMGDYWDLKITFAALKSLREEQGLSITDMCERTGMDRAAVSRLENGKLANPTINTMSRYARALGKRVMVSLADDS